MTNDEQKDLLEFPDKLDGLRTYIDGKMKRYNLLFAVNGGAFLIAQLMANKQVDQSKFGWLNLQLVAVGAIAFTVLMAFDIWKWGNLMKDMMKGKVGEDEEPFSRYGKFILIALASLLVIGWSLTLLPLLAGSPL